MEAILAEVKDPCSVGFTSEEYQGIAGLSQQTVSKRLRQMVQQGLVRDGRRRTKDVTGKQRLTPVYRFTRV